MKKNIHPKTREAVFKDVLTGTMFKSRSTAETNETVVFGDGQTYPLIKLEVSSASHPAYTGGQKIDRVSSQREKFEKRYAKARSNSAPRK